MDILVDSGIFIGSQNVVDSLREHPGIEIVKGNIVKIKKETIENCVKSAPSSFTVYRQDTQDSINIGGSEVNYVAGSLGQSLVDRKTHMRRKPVSSDLVEHIKSPEQM